MSRDIINRVLFGAKEYYAYSLLLGITAVYIIFRDEFAVDINIEEFSFFYETLRDILTIASIAVVNMFLLTTILANISGIKILENYKNPKDMVRHVNYAVILFINNTLLSSYVNSKVPFGISFRTEYESYIISICARILNLTGKVDIIIFVYFFFVLIIAIFHKKTKLMFLLTLITVLATIKMVSPYYTGHA